MAVIHRRQGMELCERDRGGGEINDLRLDLGDNNFLLYSPPEQSPNYLSIFLQSDPSEHIVWGGLVAMPLLASMPYDIDPQDLDFHSILCLNLFRRKPSGKNQSYHR